MPDTLLVLGGSGLLGSKVVAEAVSRGYSVNAPRRLECDLIDERLLANLIYEANKSCRAIINCAGAIPQNCRSTNTMIKLNALVPQNIARSARIPVIHISTDCVFSGKHGFNSVDRFPDPVDVYGRSKLLGEVKGPLITNIRTSFIGLNPFNGAGLLQWLIANKGKEINGWSGAYWSGTSVSILAKFILDALDTENNNVEHFATKIGVSKYVLLRLLNEALKLGCEITPVENPCIYRILPPTVILPPIEQAIEELANEYISCTLQ